VENVTKVDTKTQSFKHCNKKKIYKSDSGPTPVARVGSGASAPPLAAHPKRRVLEKIPGQLEASFLFPYPRVNKTKQHPRKQLILTTQET